MTRIRSPRTSVVVALFGAVAAALMVMCAEATAQTVMVRVFDEEAGRPLVGALAYLKDESGATAKNALTDQLGRALFVGIEAGTYRVDVEMIGMADSGTELFDISAGATVAHEVRMSSRAIQLEGIEIDVGGRCSVRPDGEGLLVAQVWDEARKALQAASFTDERGLYRYETMRYERAVDRNTGVVLSEDQSRQQGYMATPFESRPAEDLIENGFVQPSGVDLIYYAPDATVLLSDPFLDTHCFRLEGPRDEDGAIGLRFEPTGENRRVPDIRGTIWLDPASAQLQSLEYQYRYLEPEMISDRVGGQVDFQRMPNGTWIVPEWWIRMPVMGSQTDFQGRRRPYIAQYHVTGGLVLEAREAGGRSLGQRTATGGIEGITLDSIGLPKQGVRVGVLGSNQTVFSNAEGRFSITGLAEGRYRVRFVDQELAAIGHVSAPLTRDVVPGEFTYVEYLAPSIGDVLFQACRGVEREEGSVIVAGSVVDARGRGVAGAVVRVLWRGFRIAGGDRILDDLSNLREDLHSLETQSGDAGEFSFCGAPPDVTLTLSAELGDERTPDHELSVPEFDTGALAVLEFPNRRE